MQNNFVWLNADYADYATQILFKLKHTIIFAHFAYSLGRPIFRHAPECDTALYKS